MHEISFDTVARCGAMNVAAFEAVRKACRVGMTENEIKAKIVDAWCAHAGGDVPFSGDLVGGVRSGAIEGLPTDNVLQAGDALIVDIQPSFEGHFADTTRTFFLGEPSEQQRQVYAAVADTLIFLETVLRPGVRACDVFAAMQERLGTWGYACPHHAGHALGREKLSPPEFIPACTDVLEEGMIVALEPGVYVEGAFGVRLENNYRITTDGAERIAPYPLEIEYFTV